MLKLAWRSCTRQNESRFVCVMGMVSGGLQADVLSNFRSKMHSCADTKQLERAEQLRCSCTSAWSHVQIHGAGAAG